ncbi:unnamed protein product [Symbiodinium sp. CCMP2592]|nr:unnamed protein product [Symbiodinium sp. CCMP2592]
MHAAIAPGELASILGKLNATIQLSEEYKNRTEELINQILEQQTGWQAQHESILEQYAALQEWTKDRAQLEGPAAALPSIPLQRSCPSASSASAPRPAGSEQIGLDGPRRVWDRDFGHADFEDSDFEDYDPPAIEIEISQRVIDESVELSEDDDDVMLVADTLNDIETVEDAAMPEPYTQPAADTQASQERLLQPDKRRSYGRRCARYQLSEMWQRSSEFDSAAFCSESGMSTDELRLQLLADLERIPDKEWENPSRKNVRPTGQAKCLQKTLGLVVGAHWRGIPMPTTDTFKFRKLTGNILNYARKLGVGEATSIQVTKNLCSKPHTDKNNKGPSWIFGLGDWTEGGETFVQDDSGTEEYELQEDIPHIGEKKGKVLRGFKKDIHTLQQFDGTKIHCTVPFEGTRYAIILYAINNRSYHKTPALARALLIRLGFNLPLHEFEASIQAGDEELVGAAVEGRPVADEPGRHPPPTGRSRPSKRPRQEVGQAEVEPEEPPGARPGQPAMGLQIHRCFRRPTEPDVQEQWTLSDVEALKDMKSPKRKAAWTVIAKKLGKNEESVKRKWEELCRS